jgi:phosphohistidine phosphatase
MELYLLRHGIAADLGEGGVVRDADRPLTDEGRAKMKQEACGMRELGLNPELIFTSPLLRARQTADAVAEVLSINRIVVIAALAPGCCFARGVGRQADVFVEMSAHECERALVAGHQPDLTELASVLLTGERHLNLEFKKGALCAIDITGLPPRAPGILRWLLAPRQLRLIGRTA